MTKTVRARFHHTNISFLNFDHAPRIFIFQQVKRGYHNF